MEFMSKLEIPFEVADGIVLASMQEHLGYLKEEVRAHVEEGAYLHPEDYYNSMVKLIPALETLIVYYGGEVNGQCETGEPDQESSMVETP
jgi:hypothetical protein